MCGSFLGGEPGCTSSQNGWLDYNNLVLSEHLGAYYISRKDTESYP